MKLKRLEVENVATYRKCSIDLNELAYPAFVTGNTGAGKTTLFVDAILAALYGEPYGSRKLQKSFVSEGKPSGSVKLEFEIGGRVFVVERRLSRYGTGGTVLLRDGDSGELLASGRRAEEEIKKLVVMDADALMNSVLVRQGEVTNFLSAKPAERRNLLIRMLRLDRFQKMRENIINKLRRDEVRYEGLRREFSRLRQLEEEKKKLVRKIEELKEKLKALTAKRESLEKEKESLDVELSLVEQELRGLEAKVEGVRERMKRLEELKRESEELERKLQAIQPERTVVFDIQEVRRLLTKFYEAKAKLEEARRRLRVAREARDKLLRVKELESYLRRIGDVESAIRKTEAELEQERETLAEYRAKKKALEESLKKLQEAEATCPVCGAPLTEERKKERIKELTEEIRRLKGLIKMSELRLREKRRSLEALKKREIDKARIQARLAQLSEGLDPNEAAKVDELEKKVSELEEVVESIKERVFRLTASGSIEEVEKKLEEAERAAKEAEDAERLKERLRILQEEISQLKGVEEELRELEETVSKLRSKESELKAKLRSVEAELMNAVREEERAKTLLSSTEERLREVEAELSKKEEIERELKELDKRIRAQKMLDEAFRESGFPTYFLEEFLTLVQDYANNFLSEFGQEIEVELLLSKSGGIDIKLYSKGFERDVRTFSGGEQTLIGFAIRLAIGRALADYFAGASRPRFLIIDEGFGPLDEELRKRVTEALAMLHKMGEYEQLIVISHHAELRNSPVFGSVIRIKRGEDGASQVILDGRFLCR